MYVDTYVNGRKILKSDSLQRDIFNGSVRNQVEINAMEEYMSPRSYQYLDKNRFVDYNTEVVSVLRTRGLVHSEKWIYEFTINNEYEDQTDIIANEGIYIHDKDMARKTNLRNIRVYINVPDDDYHRRVNPSIYNIYYDEDYGHYRIRINNLHLPEGTDIVLVDNGMTNNVIVYDKLYLSDQVVDSVPIVNIDDEGKLYTELDKRTEDVEVIVDGYTLIPWRDYTVINTDSKDIPSLVAFRNVIDKHSRIEIVLHEDDSVDTYYIPYPNIGTSNQFSLSDDRRIFVERHFEVFVNNERIPLRHVEINSHRTITINGYNKPLRNVMIRFDLRTHPHVDRILSSYKYQIIDMNDNNHLDNFKLPEKSKFDEITDSLQSSSISKIMLYDLLKEKIHNDENVVFNCNWNNLLWDVELSADEIYNRYIKGNIILNMNTSLKNFIKNVDIKNPEL